METWRVLDKFERLLELGVHELHQSAFEFEIWAQEPICDQLEDRKVLSFTEALLEEDRHCFILELCATVSLNS